MSDIRLLGRVLVNGNLRLYTGLHIGGSPGMLSIGGVDSPVIRDSLSGRPYIPGSSLKGKMRSLMEKAEGSRQNRPIGKDVKIHLCETDDSYSTCAVCRLFGLLPLRIEQATPTRLFVRDVPLTDESAEELQNVAKTDLPFTEVKWEAAIDRVTSAATPRQMERVPAGAVFGPAQLVFSMYGPEDVELFGGLAKAMDLLQDDYLGGGGSRGSGKVSFESLRIICKPSGEYGAAVGEEFVREYADLTVFLEDIRNVLQWIQQRMAL